MKTLKPNQSDGVKTTTEVFKSFYDALKFLKDEWRLTTLLVLLPTLIYLRGLGNGLVSDDIPGFIENPAVRDIGVSLATLSLPKILYATSYTLFGLNPAPLHLISLLLHISTTLLAFIVLAGILGKSTAFLSSLLFTLHPVNSETVLWVSALGYSMTTIGFLLVFLSLQIYRTTGSKKHLYLTGIIHFSSFVLTRMPWEITTILKTGALGLAGKPRTSRLGELKPLSISTALIIGYMILRNWIGSRVGLFTNLSEAELATRAPYLVRIPFTTFNNLRLLLYPDKLSFFHEGEQVSSLLFAAMVLTTILILSLLINTYFRNKTVLAFGVFYFAAISLTLSPMPLSFMYAERYMYLGSLGFCALVAILATKVETVIKIKNLATYIVLLIALLYSVRVTTRIGDWANSKSLWESAKLVSPNSAQVRYALGDIYKKEGRYDEAIKELEEAIKIKPFFPDPYHHLGNTYLELGNLDMAEIYYLKALELNPRLHISLLNLGDIEFQRGNYAKALEYLNKSLEINPDFEITKQAIKIVEEAIDEAKNR